jgi:flagella synthesis protein FlgN
MQTNQDPALRARALLDIDIQASARLVELLEAERLALQQRDIARLNETVERKLEWLRALEGCERQRQQLLRAAGSEDWPELLGRLDPGGERRLLEDWGKLLGQLRDCRDLTEINDRIVRRSRRSLDHLLSLLRGQIDPVGVYDRSGKTQAYTDNRPITSA